MPALHLHLVTPERTVLKEDLDSLSVPTTLGQITILPGHIPLVATLVSGELVAKNGREEHPIHVAGGVLEVRANHEIVILADAAEHHYEIDEARATAAKIKAEKRLREEKLSEEEYALVAAQLERSLTRLNIARKHAHRHARPVTSEGIIGE